MPDSDRSQADRHDPFAGFRPLDGNFLYCPNQFFDVLLPHASRGTVRVVSYVLRKTLGWLDKNGQPTQQDIAISYRELIQHAGVSRGAIRQSLDEAVQAGFLTCTTCGRPDTTAARAVTATYRLRWNDSDAYTKAPASFHGFFAGEGHRTPVPNDFFDRVVPHESLALVKIVGCVLRHTVGYQNQFGGRRSDAPLSYTYIARYANIPNRSTLSDAIQQALLRRYIRRTQPGRLGSSSSAPTAATYAVQWQTEANSELTRSKNGLGVVQESDRIKKRTGTHSKNGPEDQFKKRTQEKTGTKNTDKQQWIGAAAVDEKHAAYELLKRVGFDDEAAQALAERHPPTVIRQQVEWLDKRHAERNRLGLLRRAIEGDWGRPESETERVKAQAETARVREHQQLAEEAAEDARVRAAQAERHRRRQEALRVWETLSESERAAVSDEALHRQNGNFLRDRFRRNADFRLQECLDVLATQAVSR